MEGGAYILLKYTINPQQRRLFATGRIGVSKRELKLVLRVLTLILYIMVIYILFCLGVKGDKEGVKGDKEDKGDKDDTINYRWSY